MKGKAKVVIEFEYPIDTANYPENVTTIAQAVEFDCGEFEGDPYTWLAMGPVDNDPEWPIKITATEVKDNA